MEHRQWNVAGSRGHVNDHAVELAPVNILPELLDNAGDDRTSPDDRSVIGFKHQVDAHELDVVGGSDREQFGIIPIGFLMNTKHMGNGWTGDIRIHDADTQAKTTEHDGKLTGDKRLAYTAFSADDADHLFHLWRIFLDGRIGI